MTHTEGQLTRESRETALKGALNTASFQAHNPIDLAAISLVLLAARLVLDTDSWQEIRTTNSAPEIIIEATQKVHHAYPEQDFTITPPEIFSIKNLEPLLELLTNIDEEESGEIATTLIEILFSRGGRGGLSALGNRTSRSSHLLAEATLSSTVPGDTVYDPACGTGDTLLRIGQKIENIQAIGNDIDSQVAAVAVLLGIIQNTHLAVSVGDTFTADIHPRTLANAVVCEPPFGMRGLNINPADPRWHGLGTHIERSGESAFLLDAVAHLAPGGKAYILTPISTLDQARWAKVRQHLITQGNIEAIVQLPPRLLTYTSIATALWVLTPAGESPKTTLINASDALAPEHSIRTWLKTLRAGGTLCIPHRTLTLPQLIQRDMQLLPDENTHTSKFRVMSSDEIEELNLPRAGKLTTLRELARDGAVHIMRPYANERLETQENSIIVNCGVHRYTARMAQAHEHIKTGSALVHVDSRILLPEYIRECIDGTPINNPGDGPAKFSPADIIVPLLSPDEQREIITQTQALRTTEEKARHTAHEAAEKRKTLMGTLRARL